MDKTKIVVTGARSNNLKNIDVEIPHKSLTVVTGLSGSGKSSLAFDTIYAEGQRRYIETFSAYARNFLGNLQRPDVDRITGLSPVISIEQKTTNRNPRSTVGTVTEVYDYLRLLFARAGEAFSYLTGEKMVKFTEEQIVNLITTDYDGQRIYVLAPLVRNRKGHYKELFESIRRKGYINVRVDGEMREVKPGMKLDRYRNHDIEVVIEKLVVNEKYRHRLTDSVSLAMKQGDGLMMVLSMPQETIPGRQEQGVLRHYSKRLMCPTTGISYHDPAPHNFSFNSPQGFCPKCKGLGNGSFFRGGSGFFFLRSGNRSSGGLLQVLGEDEGEDKADEAKQGDHADEDEGDGLIARVGDEGPGIVEGDAGDGEVDEGEERED